MSSKGQYVEERVVEMRIDHDKFESGANKTISTLERLEKALHLKSDTSALDALEKSVNNFDASPMTSGLEKIQAGFSALEIVGMRVISNLTDSIYNFTTKTIKDFTIDPIAQGFQKFGDKTTSVATLTAQGYELEKVNELMEELNWFTDETSYNFTDMVGNIAKFTATGQDLDKSVTAMEGIALWAALSGQGATKASMAMYQLSQAMGKGALKYDDYKSIQNASMDTQEFRRQAVAAAVELGILQQVGEDTWTTETTGIKNAEAAEEAYIKLQEAQAKLEKASTNESYRVALNNVNKLQKKYEEAEAKANSGYTLAQLFSSDALSRDQWFTSDVMMKVFNNYSKAANEIHRYQIDKDLNTASEAMEQLRLEAEATAKKLGITLDEAFQAVGYDVDEFSLKAFEAGQQARTWGDVVDSVKDAVSTGWMNTFENLFGNTNETIKFMTDLANEFYDIFAEGGNIRNEILKIAFGGSEAEASREKALKGWEKFEEQLASTGHTVEEFEEAYHDVARTIPEANLEGAITQYGSIKEAFANGAISAEVFNDILHKLTGTAKATAASTGEAVVTYVSDLEELKEVARGVLNGDFGAGDERRRMLEEMGYDYEAIQMLADIMYNGGQGMIGITEDFLKSNYPTLYSKIMRETVTYLGESNEALEQYDELLGQADSIYKSIVGKASDESDIFAGRPKGSELLKEGLLNIIYLIESVQGAFRGAMTDVFGNADERADRIWHIVDAFHDLTEGIQLSDDAALGLQKIIGIVLRVVKTAGTVFGSFLGVAKELIVFIAGGINSVLEMIGKGNIGVGKVLDSISKKFEKMAPYAIRVWNAVKKLVSELFKLLPFYDQFSQGDFSFLGLDKLAQKIDKLSLKKIEEAIPLVKTIHDWISKLLQKIESDDFTLFKKDVDDGTEKVGFLATAIGVLTTVFSDLYEGVKKTFANLKLDSNGITQVFNKLAEVVSFLFDGLFGNKEETQKKVSEFIITVWNGFLDGLRKISLRDVIAAVRLTIIASVAGELLSVLQNLKKTTESVATIPEAFSRILTKIGDAFGNLGKSFRANMYIKIAIALGILTVAMMALANKVDPDKLTHVAVVLGLLMFMMSKMATSFSKVFSGNTIDMKPFNVFGKLGGALIGLGILIGALGSAVAKIAAIDNKVNIWNAALVLASFMAALGFIVWIVSRAIYDYEFDEIGSFGSALLKASFAFVILALAVKMIVKPLTSITNLVNKAGGTKVWSAMGALAILIGVIGGVLYLIGNAKLGNAEASGTGMIKAAFAMVLIGIAAKILVSPLKSISELAKMKTTNLGIGFLVLVGVAALLTSVLLALNKLGNVSENGSAFMKAAAAMAIIAIAVRLMVKPLMMLGALKSIMLPALGSLLAIMVMLGGTLALLSHFNKDGDKLLKIGKALGILAIGLGILTGALGLFGAVMMIGIVVIPWDLLAKRLDAFKTSIGSLFALAGAAVLFGVAILAAGFGISAIGTGLLKASIGFVIFSFGLGLFSDGLVKVSAVIPTFIENMKKTGQAIMDVFSGKSTAQIVIGAIAIGLLVAAIIAVTIALSKLMSTNPGKISTVVGKIGKTLLSAIGGIAKGVGPAIIEHLPDILSIIVAIASVVGLYVLGIIPDLVDWIGSAIITLFDSLYEFTSKNKKAFEHSIFGIITVILEVCSDAIIWGLNVIVYTVTKLVVDAIDGIIRMIPGVGDKVADWLQDKLNVNDWLSMDAMQGGFKEAQDKIHDYFSGLVPEEAEIQHIGKRSTEALANGITTGLPNIRDAWNNVTDIFKKGNNEIENASVDSATNLPLEYADALQINAGEVEASGNKTFGVLSDILTGQADYTTVLGKLTTGNYANGLAIGKDQVLTNLEDLGISVDDAMGAIGENASIWGSNYMIDFSNGMPEGFGAVIDNLMGLGLNMDDIFAAFGLRGYMHGANLTTEINNGMVNKASEGELASNANKIGDMVVGELNKNYDKASIAGQNYIVGFNNGIVSEAKTSNLFSNINTIAGAVHATLQSGLGEHSPSVISEKAGRYYIQGLGIGMDEEKDGILSSIVSISDLLVDALMQAMSQVYTIAQDDLTLSPSIVPIVDMSNVNAAANSIGSAFANDYNVSASMSNAVSRRMNDVEDIAANMQGFGGNTTTNNEFVINIYASEGMDENEIADAVMDRMKRQFAQRTVAFG